MVDLALKNLSIDWKAGKGYHYEKGSYVEYEGNIEGTDIEILKKNIEDECNNCIEKDLVTTLEFHNDAHESGKQRRTVYYGDFGINCGGTHVAHLGIIGKINIRKIKKEKDMIRVSYEILSQ